MKKLSELSALLRGREISSVELTRAYLDAIGEKKELGAYLTVTAESALEAARAADARYAKGEPLSAIDGIPCVLKDNIVTAGVKTSCASRMLENYVPFYDAFVWERLRGAGAVLLGKGNMDEFAMGSTTESSAFFPTRNPVNPDYVPGGSSGGVAAAVAAGLAAFGLGSDTGGSIRQPASFCGVSGLKPSYGRVSRYGLVAYGSSLDQIGPMSRCAEDLALLFPLLCGRDERDMTSLELPPRAVPALEDLKGLRVGVPEELYNNCEEGVTEAVRRALDTLRALGAETVEVRIPLLDYSLPAYYIIACAEAASNLNRYDGIRYGACAEGYHSFAQMVTKTRSENFGSEVKRRIMLGNYVLSAGYFDAYYRKAQQLRAALRQEFSRVLTEVDLLVSPVSPVAGLRFGAQMKPVEVYQTDICTVPVNLTGLPALSVPCGFDGKGLPVGMQLIGRHCRDEELIAAASLFERATNYAWVRGGEDRV